MVIITGKDEAEHLNLDAILGRLAEYGLRVNLVKYQIFKDRVSNCGLDLHQGHIGVVKIKTLAFLILNCSFCYFLVIYHFILISHLYDNQLQSQY